MTNMNPQTEIVTTTQRLPSILIGMQPAFRHNRTGELHLAQDELGNPTYTYSFMGLPDDWVVERDELGAPTALHPDVVAGYWRDAQFIDIAQMSNLPLDG